MGMEDILDKLQGLTSAVVLEREGLAVLVTEYGARVLGVSYKESPNLLWVHPRIEKVIGSRDWNIGGLRVWISPERNFFYEVPQSFERWFCPRSLDPNDYRIVSKRRDGISIEGGFSLVDKATGEFFSGTLRRDIYLPGEPGVLRVRESLLADRYAGTPINIWSLAQVRPGVGGVGTVLIPVREGAEPVHYFGPIPADRLRVSEDHLSFKIDGKEVYKLGVRPEDVPEGKEAMIGYVAEVAPGSWMLLVLKSGFVPKDQGECLDVARADPEGARGCIQSYNSGPEGGGLEFGELELHFVPAAQVSNKLVSSVEYQVIVEVGSLEKAVDKARFLMGISSPYLYGA